MLDKTLQQKLKKEFDQGIAIRAEEDISSVMSQKEKVFRLSRHLGKATEDFKFFFKFLL